jgi:SAM-dependent methyltransferase
MPPPPIDPKERRMDTRYADGSAGDFDYAIVGNDYSRYRRPDRRIAARIEDLLGEARDILNVGAGAGSYEPADREVVAVEPSASMRAQRPAHRPAIDAVAEHLPFPDGHFDASMAIFTVHQWADVAAGLAEMRRVTRGPVVVLSCDPAEVERFWLNDYAPQVLSAEARRYPPLTALRSGLGGRVDVLPLPIPLDCSDGFNEAYYGRPERLLEPGARLACSAWSFVDAAVAARYVEHLREDLADGSWDSRFRQLRMRPEFHGSLRLVVSLPAGR